MLVTLHNCIKKHATKHKNLSHVRNTFSPALSFELFTLENAIRKDVYVYPPSTQHARKVLKELTLAKRCLMQS